MLNLILSRLWWKLRVEICHTDGSCTDSQDTRKLFANKQVWAKYEQSKLKKYSNWAPEKTYLMIRKSFHILQVSSPATIILMLNAHEKIEGDIVGKIWVKNWATSLPIDCFDKICMIAVLTIVWTLSLHSSVIGPLLEQNS